MESSRLPRRIRTLWPVALLYASSAACLCTAMLARASTSSWWLRVLGVGLLGLGYVGGIRYVPWFTPNCMHECCVGLENQEAANFQERLNVEASGCRQHAMCSVWWSMLV